MAEAFTVDPVAPERLSMSFVRASESCLRRAHAERELDVAGADAVVGRIFHEVAAVVGFRCVARGEAQPVPDEAIALAERVMKNGGEGEPLSKESWEDVLSLVRRWAPRAVFRPDEVFEVDSRLDLGGRTSSARIDRLAIDQGVAYVRDYKSGWADPAPALTLQGEVYGLHAFRTHEVERVVYVEDHVRFGIESEPYVIEPADADRTEKFLRTAMARIDVAYDGGELPATPGSACSSPSRCPVAGDCPVSQLARPATWLDTEEEAIAQFEQLLVGEAQLEASKLAIRGWLAREDRRALQLNGEELGYATKPGHELDKARLEADLAAGGMDVDLREYRKVKAPGFGRRKAK